MTLRRGRRFTALGRRGGLPFRNNNNLRNLVFVLRLRNSRRLGRGRRCRRRLCRRLPLRRLLPDLFLGGFPLRLRRRQRQPGLLRFVAPGGNFVSELQHLLLELR